MAEFPALTLWTDSYLSDTRTLTTLEHGAYLLLLMEAWRRPHCDLPDDPELLARMAGLSRPEWDQISTIILSFWTLDGRSKTWKQKRLTKERDQARKRSRSQRDKAAKRWNKTEIPDAEAEPETCRNDASTATATAIREEEPSGSSSLAPKRAHRLPEDFEPVLTEAAQSDAQALGPQRYADELRQFRDHHTAKGTTMKDWQAAFRTWLANAVKWTRQRNGSGNHPPRDNRTADQRAIDRRLGVEGDGRSAGSTG